MDSKLLPIDLLVVMKLVAHEGEPTSVRLLEDELGLSKSAVANSLQRLRELDLVKDGPAHGRRVNKLLLCDCLENAARWIAPASVGDFELGLRRRTRPNPSLASSEGTKTPSSCRFLTVRSEDGR
jgi:biotin operon repressor